MPEPSTREEAVSGLIERVTFFSEATGFAVLQVQVKGQRDLTTVVGSVPTVNVGEWLAARGQWVVNRDYGEQFQAASITVTPPTSLEGIEKYLASGMVKGIGPIYAKKLVETFGEKLFDIISHQSARLEEIEGIGRERRMIIKKSWEEQRAIKDIMLFLHSNGIGSSRAVRIYKTYGEEAIGKVRQNPYRLALDIHGIGFKSADELASRLGIAEDSPMRAAAGLRHILQEAGTRAGHCALPRLLLLQKAEELLQIPADILEEALRKLISNKELVQEDVEGQALVFLARLRAAERGVAAVLSYLADQDAAYQPRDFQQLVQHCKDKSGIELSSTQMEALRTILTHRFAVITGGPGVGKTTLMNFVLSVLSAQELDCLLCAPTGRAAKRLSDSTGMEAKTIHRLLGATAPQGFYHNEKHPLKCDFLLVDEVSMIDILLMHNLLRAFPEEGSLVLVGDVDQLPSVGAGAVLRDIIESGVIPVVRLTEIFRQAQGSKIIQSAHRINTGKLPPLETDDPTSDFFFIPKEDPEDIADMVLRLVTERIPNRRNLHPVLDIQVLCPMNRGILGVREMNLRLQKVLNPPGPGKPFIEKFGYRFSVGDKVMQTQNNYEKEVYNGDIGIIASLDVGEQTLSVKFDGRNVSYGAQDLEELVLAYAISIHKSQGSEFPAVVIPLSTQHYLLLQRNLLYTAVTRGKQLVVITGQEKALSIAVKNQGANDRYSGLKYRLKSEF